MRKIKVRAWDSEGDGLSVGSRMIKKKTTLEVEGLEIIGATLLTVEEAEQLSLEDRIIGCYWWLRSPGYDTFNAANVAGNGYVNYYGSGVRSIHGAIRPALQINNLKSSSLNIGDVFSIGEYDFKIISEDRVLCTASIGDCAFREDYKAEDANNYEASDVKKFVDDWFETLVRDNSKDNNILGLIKASKVNNLGKTKEETIFELLLSINKGARYGGYEKHIDIAESQYNNLVERGIIIE